MDEALLTRIDETIKAFPAVKDRFATKRLSALKKFQRNIEEHLNCTVEMLATLNEMKKALKKEIDYVEQCR